MTDPTGSASLHQSIVDLVRRHGPLPFSTVMDAALYDLDHGFFSGGGGAPGRRGDFITSPEVGPLFGAVVARALDTWWDELDRPDPFVVVEAGAGTGSLAVAVVAAAPRCAPALHYVLVERSPALRAMHGEHLPLTDPATALGVPGAGDGPILVSLADMPATTFIGVVFANELLDNLVVDLLERTDAGWAEIRVGVDGATSNPALTRHRVPASESAQVAAARFAPDAPVGATIPWERSAAEWARDALDLVEQGRLIVIDYGVDSTAELADRPVAEWLRTYRGHDTAGDPLDAIGTADVTVEVCFDQISALIGAPDSSQRQTDWLRKHGIDQLVDEGRRVWNDRAHLGDLEAIRGRSRITEAEALLDPSGLGAFRVVEWTKP